MKNVKLFEEFVNEASMFGKKAIIAKLEDKLEIAKMAVDKWGGETYQNMVTRIEGYIKNPKQIRWDKHQLVQGGNKQDDFDIFETLKAMALAKEIGKVIKKYKKYEVSQSSTKAAAGWSGTMRSTVGGDIQGRVNFNPGTNRSYLIAVTIGSGIDNKIKDKLKQELYELFFVFDEYNTSDGGVMFDASSGTNYSTLGLANSKFSYNKSFADRLLNLMNG